jgi:hypothetical protein
MKKWLFCLLLVALCSSLSAAETLRQIVNINRDWKFKLGDYPGAEAATYTDAGWDPINLPHSFSMPYFQSKDFYVGYGWYRKHLDIQPQWASKRIYLEFDGAFQDAEVYVNGTKIGEHKGGFTGFTMDITPQVHPGDNLLAVRLNNNWNAQVEPRSGDHNFMGGIYRNVRMVIVNPLHVTWYGTFVTTPQVSAQSATVHVQTEITNQGASSKNCVVTTELRDSAGKAVASFFSVRRIDPGTTVTVDQDSPALQAPQLWSPEHPVLYTAITTLSDGPAELDVFPTTFGIRSIKWTADQGFFLNGQHYYFHGADVHQDHAGWGDAITNYGAWRDVQLVKDAGLNFIRGSHYPHHPAFADACDRLGVFFWSENCFWGMGHGPDGYWTAYGYPPNPADQAPFEQNALDTLRDEIRIFRNHPSIIVWSMCNEVFFNNTPDKVKGLLTKLVAETHQLDPTRPAAIGGCQRGDIDRIGDVAGYNGDGARIKKFQNPGIPSMVTEYGSHVSDRGDPKTDIYNGMFNPKEINADTPEYPWRSGQSLWCAFDYGTILGHFGCMGFVDYFRIPKRPWYWYRNQYLHIPPPEWPAPGTPAKLSLTADKNIIHGVNATDDCQLMVTVQDASGKGISNSPPVKLTVESGPGEFPTGRSITFSPPSDDPQSDIAIRDGIAAIEFRSYYGGKSVIRATSPGLQDGVITITTIGNPQFVPGQSPVAPDRPYVRFVNNALPKPRHVQNVAANHPVSSSSETPGHEAGLANDGNAATGWEAANASPGAWWQIDLEEAPTIRSVEVDFANEGAYQFKIEGSADGAAWVMLADETQSTNTAQVRTEKVPKNSKYRYVRLTITGLPPGQAAAVDEVKIFGESVR